jgi:hypothetical protein
LESQTTTSAGSTVLNPADLELTDLHGHVWALLAEGVAKAASPFHTPALATIAERGPDVRTVVLRHADPVTREISCHTDWRSTKRSQIERVSDVCWLFYDPERKIQLRLRGRVSLHRMTDLAQERWSQCSLGSRRCYAAPVAPGTPVTEPMPAPQGVEEGWEHFTVITSVVDSVDWLYLQAEGHRRALIRWRDDRWETGWVSP